MKDGTILSFSIEKELHNELDILMKKMGYSNRSEMMRDAIRSFIEKNESMENLKGILEGIIVTRYRHKTEHEVHSTFHGWPDIIRSFLHVDFEDKHNRCCDIVIFKGDTEDVRSMMKELQSTVGVEDVKLVML